MPIPHHLTLHHHSLSFDLFHRDPSFALIHVLFHFRNRFFWCGTCNLRRFQSVSEEKWESWHQFSNLLYLQRKTVGYHVCGHGQLQLELPSLFWDLQSFRPAYQSPASMFYKNPHFCPPPNIYALSIRILRNFLMLRSWQVVAVADRCSPSPSWIIRKMGQIQSRINF